MDVQGNYNPVDANGFIRCNALRLQEYSRLRAKQAVSDNTTRTLSNTTRTLSNTHLHCLPLTHLDVYF